MPLTILPLDLDPAALPDAVHDLIDEADRRCDAFYEAGFGKRFPRYVPSDPVMVHAALVALRRDGALRGELFCEWGCGFGVATSIAGLLGFEAHGIEIEPELAGQAVRLAADLGIDVTIMARSFLPEGYDVSEGMGGIDLVKPTGFAVPATYDELDPADIDIFFVYPWPGEEEFVMELFEEIASEDAVLLMYQGEGEIVACLKDLG